MSVKITHSAAGAFLFLRCLLTPNYKIMKRLYTTVLLAVLYFPSAQVIIGDQTGTAPAGQKGSVLLEFAAGQNKGLVLPYLRVLPAAAAEGTIILDASVSSAARVKYYNGSWFDLSGQDGDISSALSAQPTAGQAPEDPGAKTIIGARSSAADGILVLESADKAMVLPVVSDVQNISNPSPGMMVYVNREDAKRLAVFNGNKWSFWKP